MQEHLHTWNYEIQRQIKPIFFGRIAKRDMNSFVKTCDQCQKAGKPNDKKKAPLKLVPVIQECSDYRVFERFGILVRHSSVYHPQSNPVERFHRTLKRLLRVLCLDAGSEWDKHLPSILLALRTVLQGIHRQSWCMGKFANPRDVSNGTLDGTGRRG
ncbi:retrovirus-related Pol polyprotein from transposon 297 [Trichonephila clavipes]|nr:retrovirus-related Pol polyprotein from transposon 297 [Trichonephila clavipes]